MLLCTLQYTYRYITSRDFYISFVYFNPVSNARVLSLSLSYNIKSRVSVLSLALPPRIHYSLNTSHWPQSLTTYIYKPVKHAREMLGPCHYYNIIIINARTTRPMRPMRPSIDAIVVVAERTAKLSLKYIILLCYCV